MASKTQLGLIDLRIIRPCAVRITSSNIWVKLAKVWRSRKEVSKKKSLQTELDRLEKRSRNKRSCGPPSKAKRSAGW